MDCCGEHAVEQSELWLWEDAWCVFLNDNNSDLLNLLFTTIHLPNEQCEWFWLVKALACIEWKLVRYRRLFQKQKIINLMMTKRVLLLHQLDALYKLLDLSPYDHEGVYHQADATKLKKDWACICYLSHSMQCKLNCARTKPFIWHRNHDIQKQLYQRKPIMRHVHVLSGNVLCANNILCRPWKLWKEWWWVWRKC